MSKDNNDVVIIQLDRPRHLKFGYRALKTLVELTGQTLEEIDQKLDVSNFEFLEQMVYCGLLKDVRDNGETLNLEQIPDLLDDAPSFSHIVEKTIAAWYAAFGAQQKSEGNLGAPEGKSAKSAKNSTGKKARG